MHSTEQLERDESQSPVTSVASDYTEVLTLANHVETQKNNLLTDIKEGFVQFRRPTPAEKRALEEQCAAASKWCRDKNFDEWGHPSGTEHVDGFPTRQGLVLNVKEEAQMMVGKGFERPPQVIHLLYLRYKHYSQPWCAPPYMSMPEEETPWWWWARPDSSSWSPFLHGGSSDIEKAFSTWVEEKSKEYMQMLRGMPYTDHSSQTTEVYYFHGGDIVNAKVKVTFGRGVYPLTNALLTEDLTDGEKFLEANGSEASQYITSKWKIRRTMEVTNSLVRCICDNWVPESAQNCLLCGSEINRNQ